MRSAIIVASVCACFATAHAQDAQSSGAAPQWEGRDEEARQLFEAGAIAYRDGHYEDAEPYFRRAYELSHRAQLLFNLGNAAERARHDDAALAAYEEFLRLDPNTDLRARVETRIAALRAAGAHGPSSGGSDAGPWPWVVVSGSAAVAIVGAILVGLAVADVGSVQAAAMGSRWSAVADAYGRSEALSIAGFVMMGVGVAGAALGVVWALLPSGGSRASASLRVGPGSLWLEGVF